ncbi:hypothetical protein B0H14DRAFT_2647842 [Mycena olivaceomarginata]|nr:hypothetical protein B0H14DRAFT_2647842 [Mycena olivaceomarginata]
MNAHFRTLNQEHNNALQFFGEGLLIQSVGDALDRSGIMLMPLYRITEVGPITQIIPDEVEAAHSHGWEYFQFHASLEPVLVPMNGDTTGSLFQLIVKQSARNCLVLLNTEVDGVPAYNTSDIVKHHPEVLTLYRVYGRVGSGIEPKVFN